MENLYIQNVEYVTKLVYGQFFYHKRNGLMITQEIVNDAYMKMMNCPTPNLGFWIVICKQLSINEIRNQKFNFVDVIDFEDFSDDEIIPENLIPKNLLTEYKKLEKDYVNDIQTIGKMTNRTKVRVCRFRQKVKNL